MSSPVVYLSFRIHFVSFFLSWLQYSHSINLKHWDLFAHIFYFLFSLGDIRKNALPPLDNGSKNIPSSGKGIFYREASSVLHMITHSLSLPKPWRDSFSDLCCEKLLGLLEWKPWINGANSKNVVSRHFSLCDYFIFSLKLRSLWLH